MEGDATGGRVDNSDALAGHLGDEMVLRVAGRDNVAAVFGSAPAKDAELVLFG